MRNPLIKKQFLEIFKSYFVNAKTGEKRSKGKTALLFSLFSMLLLFLCATFFVMALLLVDLIKGPAEFRWIYFAVMGIITIVLGLFGSVFNTYATLYLSKDNELLLSLPISPFKILSSRLTMVYGLSLMYSGIVWVPVCVLYFIFGHPSALAVIFCVCLLFIISLFVTVLTVALGFVVALLSVRLKNNAILTVFITLAAISAYYFIWFRMTETLRGIVENPFATGEGIKKWGNIFFLLGKASTGDIKYFGLFLLISVALFAVALYILAKTFVYISTIKLGGKKETATFKSDEKTKKPSERLLWRETKRFLSSPTYMLNCALGTILGPIGAVALLIKRKTILQIIEVFRDSPFDIDDYLPLIIAGIGLLVVSTNTLSTPSISLEGKNLWILKSLPVDYRDILIAKRNFHLILTVPTTIISFIVAGVTLGFYKEEIIVISALLFFVAFFEANMGLVLGLHRSDFNWTNETKAIKQSLNSLIILLIGWIIPVAVIGGYYLIDRYTMWPITSFVFICIALAVFVIILAITDRYVTKKGPEIFKEF